MRFSAAFVAAAAPMLAMASPIKMTRALADTTVAVLKFAQLLEQLETQFYTQALAKFTPQDFTTAGISVPDVAIDNFKSILEHETAHTAVLTQALSDNGDEPLKTCTFNFDPVLTDVATMAAVARTVEHVGVGAYLGGADLIKDPSILGAAATILTTEARHQSILNIIAGATSVPQAVDVALTPQDVLSIAGAFISGCDPATEIGLPAGNPPLAITNSGTVAAGTKLEFSSPALNSSAPAGTSCQMLVGDGSIVSKSFPVNDCIVPEGIDGPVWIWLTTDEQALNSDIHNRATDKILAGPTAAFIDSRSNALGALVRNAGNGFSSSQTISPSDASSQLASATLTETGIPAATSLPTSSPTAVAPISVIGVGVIPASSAR